MISGPQNLTDYAAVTEYLYALKAGGVKFGIDRMRRLAEVLSHPERSYPVIHVAGTNGKGSVAAMVESILRASGRRTGLYTSPHLVKLGERVQVDRRVLTEAEIVAYAAELKPAADSICASAPDEQPTFFEFMTAMAFLQFQRKRVEVAVVEVGMGGRLDATTVVEPEVSVITSIGLDHCAELGDTFEQIAREKAGIIKPGRPVVIGSLWNGQDTPPETMDAQNNKRSFTSRSGHKLTFDDTAGAEKVAVTTQGGHAFTLDDAAGGKITLQHTNGTQVEIDAAGNVRITANANVEVQAAMVKITASMVTVDAAMSKFSGVVQADTVITNSVVSASYTPGAGNMW